ncbi:hypothetical protein CPLU01_03480 [Colletotrichum plurivorum]|uniref:Uncharacterized protein n=1 Tax=Colletotrichum plurivorum TaxID=2175906 RepID=A0A8H6NLC6_9PEZI|nr:hypothetical protein CPLU01_03480 [Colletotrichum plurivorum]
MSSSGGALKKGKMRGGFGGQRRKSGGSARCGVGSRGVIHWRCESEKSSSRLESGGANEIEKDLVDTTDEASERARALRENLQGKNGDEDEEYETLNIKVWEGPE